MSFRNFFSRMKPVDYVAILGCGITSAITFNYIIVENEKHNAFIEKQKQRNAESNTLIKFESSEEALERLKNLKHPDPRERISGRWNRYN